MSKADLHIRISDNYSEDWADFVFANREGNNVEQYDIVYGPIANDKIGLQIRKLKDGSIDRAEFLNRLKYMKGITLCISLVLRKLLTLDKIMSDSDFKYMKEALATDLAELLSKDFGTNVTESLDTLYSSETYAKCVPGHRTLFSKYTIRIFIPESRTDHRTHRIETVQQVLF